MAVGQVETVAAERAVGRHLDDGQRQPEHRDADAEQRGDDAGEVAVLQDALLLQLEDAQRRQDVGQRSGVYHALHDATHNTHTRSCGLPRLFTVTSEHIRLFLFSFFSVSTLF